MRQTYIVIDGFYKNPKAVRDHALSMEFKKPEYKTGFPGLETDSIDNENIKPIMQNISQILGKQIGWEKDSEQGMFRLMGEEIDKTGINTIHTDPCRWVGIVFLNPEEQCKGGISLYKHKSTGISRLFPENEKELNNFMTEKNMSLEETHKFFYEEGKNVKNWVETDFISCMPNRLVLFDGGIFHGFKDLFGTTKEDTRLTQHFFFYEINNEQNKNIFST